MTISSIFYAIIGKMGFWGEPYHDYFALLQAMLFVSQCWGLMQSTHGCLCSVFHGLSPVLSVISEKILYFLRKWSFAHCLIVINGICSNLSRYTVYHATNKAGAVMSLCKPWNSEIRDQKLDDIDRRMDTWLISCLPVQLCSPKKVLQTEQWKVVSECWCMR